MFLAVSRGYEPDDPARHSKSEAASAEEEADKAKSKLTALQQHIADEQPAASKRISTASITVNSLPRRERPALKRTNLHSRVRVNSHRAPFRKLGTIGGSVTFALPALLPSLHLPFLVETQLSKSK